MNTERTEGEAKFYSDQLDQRYGPLDGWEWNALFKRCSWTDPGPGSQNPQPIFERLAKHHDVDFDALGTAEDAYGQVILANREADLLRSTEQEDAAVTTDEYFGGCPKCGKCEGALNISRTHWHFCDTHKVKWCVGSNLFSSWRDEDEAVWARNAEVLRGYEEVKPISPPHDEAATSDEKKPYSVNFFDTVQFLASVRRGRMDKGLKSFVEQWMLQGDMAAMKAAEAAVIEWRKHETCEMPF